MNNKIIPEYEKLLEGKMLTSREVEKIIDWQLTLPEGDIDVDLINACRLYLLPEEGSLYAPGKERVWAGIERNIAEGGASARGAEKKRISGKRLAVIMVTAVLLLGLASVAVSMAVERGIFNFIFDFGFDGSDAIVQEGAEDLRYENLLYKQFPHTDFAVREASYDGIMLRVVYSLWDRDATKPVDFSNEEYVQVTEGAKLDGITMCDWIEVDGQDYYFTDQYGVQGAHDGEILVYMSTNLLEAGYTPVGDTMTIGLPIVPATMEMRERREYIYEDHRFTIPTAIPKGYVRQGELFQTEIAGTPASLDMAIFSPIGGYIHMSLYGEELEIEPEAMAWGEAEMFNLEGEKIGITSINYWGYQTEGVTRIAFNIYPPETWPEEFVFAIPNGEGAPDPVHRLAIRLLPVE